MNDEEYERIKREIGWHASIWDFVFFLFAISIIALIVWMS